MNLSFISFVCFRSKSQGRASGPRETEWQRAGREQDESMKLFEANVLLGSPSPVLLASLWPL